MRYVLLYWENRWTAFGASLVRREDLNYIIEALFFMLSAQVLLFLKEEEEEDEKEKVR